MMLWGKVLRQIDRAKSGQKRARMVNSATVVAILRVMR
jgi:hypothetical protein